MPTTDPPPIRSATDADLPELRRIAADGFDRERVDPAGIVDLLHSRPAVPGDLRLVAAPGGTVSGFCYASATGPLGSLDAVAVDGPARRRGLATALLTSATDRLARLGCTSVRTGGSTWHYAWPGIDLAYTPALLAAERAGLVRETLVHNLDVDLTDWVAGRAASLLRPSAGADGTALRRGRAADGAALRALIGRHFDAAWQHEMEIALDRAVPTCFVAERASGLVGFAAYGVYRPDLFGPLGTDPAVRGSGVGRALLSACLDDLAATGLAVAQISWVGPTAFYANAVDARIGRTFAVLGAPLQPGPAGGLTR